MATTATLNRINGAATPGPVRVVAANPKVSQFNRQGTRDVDSPEDATFGFRSSGRSYRTDDVKDAVGVAWLGNSRFVPDRKARTED